MECDDDSAQRKKTRVGGGHPGPGSEGRVRIVTHGVNFVYTILGQVLQPWLLIAARLYVFYLTPSARVNKEIQ